MIGERLKFLREEKGLRQSDLANKLGVSQQTISQYEKDVREPDSTMSKKIATFFGVSIDYLYGNSSERSPADKIKSALSSDPELADFWDKLSKREDLQLLFKQTKDMSPDGVKQIIRIIKAIEDEEEKRYNS
jgi:transcriptional regulator with XRE-family HTH domain